MSTLDWRTDKNYNYTVLVWQGTIMAHKTGPENSCVESTFQMLSKNGLNMKIMYESGEVSISSTEYRESSLCNSSVYVMFADAILTH